MKEFEQVVLISDFPEENLIAGDVGTIVYVHDNGVAYEVEFFLLDGETAAVLTVEANQLRAVQHGDIIHARSFADAA